MNKLRKDDPVYYKVELTKLLKEARENGLEIGYLISSFTKDLIKVSFEASNGDIASVVVYDRNWSKEIVNENRIDRS